MTKDSFRLTRYSFREILVAICVGTLLGIPLLFAATVFQATIHIVATLVELLLPRYGIPMLAVAALSGIALLTTWFGRRMLRSLRSGLIRIDMPLLTCLTASMWLFADILGFVTSFVAHIASALLLWPILSLLNSKAKAGSENSADFVDVDSPLEEGGDDILGRRPIVDGILSTILFEKPLVVAVTAPWGDGKTSFVNLLLGELRKVPLGPPPIIVKFSPWLAGDSDAIVVSLLNSVRVEINKVYFSPAFKKDAIEYGRALVDALPKIDKLKSFFSEPSQQEKVEALAKRIAATSRRIVIVLDDLDRMDGKELETVFRILRGSEALRNTTFICSFDEIELANILKTTRSQQDTSRFIEKFFQVRIALPKIDSTQLKPLLEERTNRMLQACKVPLDNLKSLDEIWEKGGAEYFTNLRRIKLFMNRIGYTLQRIGREVNLGDLFVLEIVHAVSPALYDQIYENPSYFFDSDLAFEFAYSSKLPRNPSEIKVARNEFYRKIFDSDKGVPKYVADLLALVFPYVAEFKDTPFKGRPGGERDWRAFHPRFFRQYFTFKVPSELFSQVDFDQFMSEVKSGPLEVAEHRFEAVFSSLEKTEFKRWHFIHLIEMAFQILTSEAKQGLCMGFAHKSGAWTSDAFEVGAAIRCTGETLRAITLDSDKQQFLLRLIEEAQSMQYVLVLVRVLERDFRYALPSTMEPVKEKLLVSVRNHYPNTGKPSIFEEMPSDMGRIDPIQFLFGWARLGLEGQRDQDAYLRSLLARDINALRSFPKSMFRIDFMDDYSALKPLIDYRYLNSLIREHEGELDFDKVEQFKHRLEADPQFPQFKAKSTDRSELLPE